MYNVQGQFVGFQFLIKKLSLEKESTFLVVRLVEVSSILYVGLKYPIEFWPKYTVFICGTKNSDCDWVYILLFHKNGTGVAFDARDEPLYAFPLLVAECCNHEQKANYLSLKETQKKKYYHHKSFLRLFHEDNSVINLPSMKHPY